MEETETATNTETVGENAEETTTEATKGLVDTYAPQEPEVAPAMPTGFSDKFFNAETREIDQKALSDFLVSEKAEKESFKKQALDMRRKLSKGVEIPKEAEAYNEGFALEERFNNIQEESIEGQWIKETMKGLNEFAFNNSLTKEQANAMKKAFFEEMERLDVLHTETPEQKREKEKQRILKEFSALGENAGTIIKENVDFLQSYGIFSDDEKKFLFKACNNYATGNTIVSKIRKLFGQNSMAEIPTPSAAFQGLADDVTLAREYNLPETTKERRLQILQDRMNAGRNTPLPVV